MHRKRLYVMLGLLAAAALLLAACGQQAPAEPELGTEENPVTWVLTPSQDTQAVLSGAEDIAQHVEDETGIVIESFVATDYTAQVEAMCGEEAEMGAINTFGYVRASERGCADAALVSVRFGSPTYSGQLNVRADADIGGWGDLAGATFCRPDPGSTSGWIIPTLEMQAAGVNPDSDLDQIVDAGGHDGVIIAIYNGDCDAGASFVDARVIVEEDFPDVNEQVAVVSETDAIPNDTIAFHPDFPEDLRQQIVDALLQLNETEEGVETLNGLFSWEGLQEVDDGFYDGFRQKLDAAGVEAGDIELE